MEPSEKHFFFTKLAWDRRSWFLGLTLGNLAGLMLLVSGNPASRHFLEAAYPYGSHGYYMGDFVQWAGVALGAFIFPAVLSLAARRVFALWGLLPITLFVLWIVAGAVVAHRLSAIPFWALPLAAFLCWIAACWPISLLRYVLRRRSHPSAASSAPLKPPYFRLLRLAFALVSALGLILVGWQNLRGSQRVHSDISIRWRLGQEARVPLTVRNDGLYVMARLNGAPELCRIDTGYDSVSWPSNFNLEGQLKRQQGENCDALDVCRNMQTVLMKSIGIGSYEVTGLPTEMVDSAGRLFSPVSDGTFNAAPTLGNSAFCLTVLTIDYQKREMIIRSPVYDLTKQPRHPGDRILQMGWTSDWPASAPENALFGFPVVRASIKNIPFWCTIDTGWNREEMGLVGGFVDKHPLLKQLQHGVAPLYATNSSGLVSSLDPVDLQLPCLWPSQSTPIHVQAKALVPPAIYGGDGIIGLALLQKYRVTLDYQRKRVLLEPYGS